MPTDSAFTIQITPAAEATYYAYVISTAPAKVDSATLIKGGYSNSVLKVSEKASLTINVKTAEPNTTYYVYASACNEKGIVGKLASASIKTSDTGAPTPTAAQASAANKAYLVQFNQAILRGEGKVTAVFYKEYDFENPVQSENVDVQINGKVTQLTAVDAPAGAFVLFSWEEGAFVDATGNACGAFTSGVNPEGETVEDIFQGLWLRVPTADWAIADSNVAPATGASIGDWTEFTGTITMPFDIFAIAEDAEDGDIAVTYKGASRTTIYNLPAGKYAVSGKTISFVLPSEPVKGDIISVSVKEGIAFDVYGNPNSSYSSEKVVWKYVGFIPTKENVLGTFSYLIDIEGTPYDLGQFTIEEYTGEDAKPGDVVIKNLYIPGSEIYGTYDLDAYTLSIDRYQPLGILNDEKEGDYGVLTYSKGGLSASPFDINPDGTLTSSDFLLAGAAPDYSALWWYEIPSKATTTFAKVTASAPKRASLASSKIAKKRINGAAKKNFKLYRK
jgi:uncharacterized protein (DUF2141 family)